MAGKKTMKKKGSTSVQPTKKKAAKLSPPVVKAVKNILNAQTETKLKIADVVSAGTAFTRGITSVAEIYPCLPPVNVSTSSANSHTRVGDLITPTSLTIKGRVSFTFNTQVARSITVHIFCLSAHAVKNWDNYSAIPITTLLDNGAGSDVQFDGTVRTSLLPVNRQTFTVHKYLKFPLVKALGNTNASISTPTDSVISPGYTSKEFTIRLKTPKFLKYALSGSYPQNFAPFLCMGWTYNDEATAGDAPSQLITMNSCLSYLRYKDD